MSVRVKHVSTCITCIDLCRWWRSTWILNMGKERGVAATPISERKLAWGIGHGHHQRLSSRALTLNNCTTSAKTRARAAKTLHLYKLSIRNTGVDLDLARSTIWKTLRYVINISPKCLSSCAFSHLSTTLVTASAAILSNAVMWAENSVFGFSGE